VLTNAHERFYTHALNEVPTSQRVVQPGNKGTAPAILYSLLRVQRMDPAATVAFLPSDHYYTDDCKFAGVLETALDFAESNSHAVVLLGAHPDGPEVEYGWIDGPQHWGDHSNLSCVKHFWEKPSLEMARLLRLRDCLWNTFVMVGRVTAFLDTLTAVAPQLCRAFQPLASCGERELRAVRDLYAGLPSLDFSKSVLVTAASRFAVLRLGEVEWSDLGSPMRTVNTVHRAGADLPWIQAWRQANPVLTSLHSEPAQAAF
jgi:mannose-1-phosphate guanylyltransferase